MDPMLLPQALALTGGIFGGVSMMAYRMPAYKMLSYGNIFMGGLFGLLELVLQVFYHNS